jgi:hypothetical protein
MSTTVDEESIETPIIYTFNTSTIGLRQSKWQMLVGPMRPLVHSNGAVVFL